jgi:CRISPR type III-A-associated protein Csm2
MAEKGQKIELKILSEGIKSIENLKKWGHYFAEDKDRNFKKVSTSQLRKFFGALKQIQADFNSKKGEIILLDAKLAYAVGRDIKNGFQQTKIKEFYDEISPLIREIKEDKTKFKYFVDVFEAIVAYHKEKEDIKTQNY